MVEREIRMWRPGEPEGDLHGFVSREERDAYQEGHPGPFRRVVRPAHLGPIPADLVALREITAHWEVKPETKRLN